MKHKCTQRDCDGIMQKGVAMGQTFTWHKDFGDEIEPSRGCTISYGGPGRVIPARKCNKCGHSITLDGKEVK